MDFFDCFNVIPSQVENKIWNVCAQVKIWGLNPRVSLLWHLLSKYYCSRAKMRLELSYTIRVHGYGGFLMLQRAVLTISSVLHVSFTACPLYCCSLFHALQSQLVSGQWEMPLEFIVQGAPPCSLWNLEFDELSVIRWSLNDMLSECTLNSH